MIVRRILNITTNGSHCGADTILQATIGLLGNKRDHSPEDQKYTNGSEAERDLKHLSGNYRRDAEHKK